MRTNIKNQVFTYTFLFLLIVPIFVGCKKKETVEPDPIKQEAPALVQKVNEFIKASMEDVYLWEQYLPVIDTKYEFDSKEYFDKLLYTEDKWSFITDDIKALEDSFQGVETSFGYSLAFYWKDSNRTSIVALIEYVYPNSPAAIENLKRGDMIYLLNGAEITIENYMDLLNGSNISITLGISNNGSITQGSSHTLTSLELNLDPVMFTKIIEENGHKIGYLFYAQYISNYNTSLDAAFQYLKNNGITDLVLDIRYNPGGYMSAAQHLCSSIAPLAVVTAQDALVTLQWNSYYQNYWETNSVFNQIRMNYVSTPVNLNLSKIYILTGSGSASASELTITGLDPYMEVVLIGDTTYGKYTGSITLKPEDIYNDVSYYTDFDNWGIQPIVLRYANANGVTDFKNGFAPDFYIKDNLSDGTQLGDKTEALFAKAIEQITGTVKIGAMKRQELPPYQLYDHGFSRFDNQKRNLIVDWLKPNK